MTENNCTDDMTWHDRWIEQESRMLVMISVLIDSYVISMHLLCAWQKHCSQSFSVLTCHSDKHVISLKYPVNFTLIWKSLLEFSYALTLHFNRNTYTLTRLWATIAEKHIRLHSCPLRARIWDYHGHGLTETALFTLEKEQVIILFSSNLSSPVWVSLLNIPFQI